MRWFETKWPAVLLLPLSILYWFVTKLRNVLFDIGMFKSYQVNCKVVSVGNITVGGTGKTPVVQYLASVLSTEFSLCVLSRGYKRSSTGTMVVSDGSNILCSVREAGDEPFLLAQQLEHVPVLVDQDRVRGANIAIKRFAPDIILLDDGFQHRRLYRDVDILTLRAGLPFGNDFMLPAGPLREPKSGLKRASIFWTHGEAPVEIIPLRVPVVKAMYTPVARVTADGRRLPVELSGVRIVAFCGLANPASFRATLEQLEGTIADWLTFEDHHMYTEDDMKAVWLAFQQTHADIILTTQKDWVKLPDDLPGRDKWQVLQIRVVPNNPDMLLQTLKKCINVNQLKK